MLTIQESSHPQPMSVLSSAVIVLLCQAILFHSLCSSHETETVKPANCAIYKYVGANDLSVNDIVVKSVTGNTVCIKARFSLAIKVEAKVDDDDEKTKNINTNSDRNLSHIANKGEPSGDKRMVLGYLPLDSIVSIEDTCPDLKSTNTEGSSAEKSARLVEEPKDLEMVILFECGRLVFSFKRENKYYMSAIRGAVNLDSSTVREFNSEKPMFFTSDLTHHFKLNDLVEVNSTDKPKAFILTANFYHLEFEAFRNTSSRNFIRPPDENSKPFLLDEQ